MLLHGGVGAARVEPIDVSRTLSPALLSGQVDAPIGARRGLHLEEKGLPPGHEPIRAADPQMTNVIRRVLSATEMTAQLIGTRPRERQEIFAGPSVGLQNAPDGPARPDTAPRFTLRPEALGHEHQARFKAALEEAGLIERAHPASHLSLHLEAK